MFITKEPTNATFAVEMLTSPSPLALRTRSNTEAVLDFQLFELDVDLVVASVADKATGRRSL